MLDIWKLVVSTYLMRPQRSKFNIMCCLNVCQVMSWPNQPFER